MKNFLTTARLMNGASARICRLRNLKQRNLESRFVECFDAGSAIHFNQIPGLKLSLI